MLTLNLAVRLVIPGAWWLTKMEGIEKQKRGVLSDQLQTNQPGRAGKRLPTKLALVSHVQAPTTRKLKVPQKTTRRKEYQSRKNHKEAIHHKAPQ